MGTRVLTNVERAKRNQNPHRLAILAMFAWGREYSEFSGGSMDFWDQLDDSRKRVCREIADRLERAPAK